MDLLNSLRAFRVQGQGSASARILLCATPHRSALVRAPMNGMEWNGFVAIMLDALALPCRSKRENKLVDSQPKALYHPLPVLFVTAVLGSEKKSVRQSAFNRNAISVAMHR